MARDLDYSDRFEVIPLTQPSPSDGSRGATTINYAFYRTLGAALARCCFVARASLFTPLPTL